MGSYSVLESGRCRLSLENLFRILQVLGASARRGCLRGVAEGPERARRNTHRLALDPACCGPGRSATPKPIGIDDLIGIVCAGCHLSRAEIRAPSRARDKSLARALVALLVREEAHLTPARLAKVFECDVSTFSHALRRLKEWVAGDVRPS